LESFFEKVVTLSPFKNIAASGIIKLVLKEI